MHQHLDFLIDLSGSHGHLGLGCLDREWWRAIKVI